MNISIQRDQNLVICPKEKKREQNLVICPKRKAKTWPQQNIHTNVSK
jgi:hypothetical protein